MASRKKHTIGNVSAGFFIGIAVLLDALKFFLVFLDAIPIVGIPASVVASEVVSLFEFIFIFVPLYISGAYKGKNGATSGLVTMMVGMIDGCCC